VHSYAERRLTWLLPLFVRDNNWAEDTTFTMVPPGLVFQRRKGQDSDWVQFPLLWHIERGNNSGTVGAALWWDIRRKGTITQVVPALFARHVRKSGRATTWSAPASAGGPASPATSPPPLARPVRRVRRRQRGRPALLLAVRRQDQAAAQARDGSRRRAARPSVSCACADADTDAAPPGPPMQSLTPMSPARAPRGPRQRAADDHPATSPAAGERSADERTAGRPPRHVTTPATPATSPGVNFGASGTAGTTPPKPGK
jgi:hypothetical protein